MKTSTNNSKSDLKECFALWENHKGDMVYYTGKTSDGKVKLVAFVNTTKKNPNQPDIQVYEQAGKYYYGGQDNEEKKLVGFDNKNTENGKISSDQGLLF